MEVLSSAPKGMSRKMLMAAAEKGNHLMVLMPTSDALCQLVLKGKVTIKDGLYSLSEKKESANEVQEPTDLMDSA